MIRVGVVLYLLYLINIELGIMTGKNLVPEAEMPLASASHQIHGTKSAFPFFSQL